MTTLLYKIGVAAVIVGLAFGAGYVKGKNAGRIDQLQATVEAYKTRKAIEGDVQNLDAYALCDELGGLPDECEQLRGLDQAAEAE